MSNTDKAVLYCLCIHTLNLPAWALKCIVSSARTIQISQNHYTTPRLIGLIELLKLMKSLLYLIIWQIFSVMTKCYKNMLRSLISTGGTSVKEILINAKSKYSNIWLCLQMFQNQIIIFFTFPCSLLNYTFW